MIKYCITPVLLLLFIACLNGDQNRNKIVFKDNIDTVQNALIHLQSLLDSLPPVQKGADFLPNYGLQNGYLSMNNFHQRRVSDTMTIPGLSKESSSKFINLALFLKDNFVSSANKPLNSNVWFFNYRKVFDENYDDIREIIVFKDKTDTVNLSVDNQILDHKRNLLLLAPKDAKIR